MTEREFLEWAMNTLHEINVSNYDHDDVCRLNERSVEVILAIKARLSEQPGANPELADPPASGVDAVAELDAFYQGWLARWRDRLASLSPAATPGLAMPSREWMRDKVAADPDIEDCGAAPAATSGSEAGGEIDATQKLLDKALTVLGRCHTVLFNMAKENEGAIFNRWPIHHEPLRSDARNLLPLIDEVLGHD